MTIIHIDERRPEAPLESQAVLHVRRHLRRSIKQSESTAPSDLAHFFGFSRSDGTKAVWQEAAAKSDPIQAGALVSAQLRPNIEGVVSLGYDEAHIKECKLWLQERKNKDGIFSKTQASDLATLLELSKARDLAIAEVATQDTQHKRYLPILIQGPTGSGKELLAKSIHEIWKKSTGQKKDAPWIPLQIAGMPKDIINDELFGHVKGSYTGASNDRIGRIEEADGGTLLIDEVGDLPPEAQLRLLRFLQEGEFSKQGENKVKNLNVRVIAATWHNLERDVKRGSFRKDLFYRLCSGSQLILPSLTQRFSFFDEILPILLEERRIKSKPVITRSAKDALESHSWPGNVRELISVIDEATAFASGQTIRLEHLPWHLQDSYSQLSLKQRAMGFLTDEIDGQEITEEQAEWRVQELDKIVLTTQPKEEFNIELVKAFNVLSEINDPEKSHQNAIEKTKLAIGYEAERKFHEGCQGFWVDFLQEHRSELPNIIKKYIKNNIKKIQEKVRDLNFEFKVALDSAKLTENRWLETLQRAQNLPVFKGVDTEFLLQLLSFSIKVITTFNPESLDEFKNELHTGNIIKALSVMASPLKALDQNEDDRTLDAEDEEIQERIKPSSIPRDYWVSLTKIDSLRSAAKESGYDTKTIEKYLKINKIKNPWRKASN